jgi:hypothetical protein
MFLVTTVTAWSAAELRRCVDSARARFLTAARVVERVEEGFYGKTVVVVGFAGSTRASGTRTQRSRRESLGARRPGTWAAGWWWCLDLDGGILLSENPFFSQRM